MTGASDLRTLLTLQAPVEIADGQGGVTRSFASQGAIWAQVEALGSREGVAAATDGATQRLRIVARAPLALGLQHRLLDGEKIYRITSYRDDGRFVVIDAELRVG